MDFVQRDPDMVKPQFGYTIDIRAAEPVLPLFAPGGTLAEPMGYIDPARYLELHNEYSESVRS
jgi:hypothetical protein